MSPLVDSSDGGVVSFDPGPRLLLVGILIGHFPKQMVSFRVIAIYKVISQATMCRSSWKCSQGKDEKNLAPFAPWCRKTTLKRTWSGSCRIGQSICLKCCKFESRTMQSRL